MSDVLVATETKTYRGASIEELLPQIRAELGPEAVIVTRREGLIGGVAGFFQKKCVEVDARAGGPRIDVYDDGGDQPETVIEPPAVSEPHIVRNDAATREGLETPAVQRLVSEGKPFSDLLEEMTPQASPVAKAYAAPEPEPDPEVEHTPEPKRIASLREGMVAAGLGADLAADVVDAVVANVAPFATPSRLRTLVRNELALRLPVAPAPGPGRRHLAVVGPAGPAKPRRSPGSPPPMRPSGRTSPASRSNPPTAAPRCGRCSRAPGSRSKRSPTRTSRWLCSVAPRSSS